MRPELRWWTFSLGMTAFLFSAIAGAEIYKWTDEHGNVHFGDKPMDEGIAEKAETVEVDEAYKPPQRSEGEIRAMQGQQRARMEADRRRREADEKRLAQEKEKDDKRKAEICAALDADIETFGSAKMVNGIRTIHYLYDEDGKSISAAEQRKIVDDLRARREEMGCP